MSGLRSVVGRLWPRSKLKKVVLLLVILFVAGSGGFITVSEQTWFCNSCHIMNPYYASWQASDHSQVNCLECHVQPGFAGIVRAKLNGLAQAADCFLDRVSPKPSALVEDASCLREGCHTKESLLAESLTDVDGKYKFSHRGHIDAKVSELPLLCTTCHSHFEGQEHFKVSTQVCFVCHFSRADTATVRLVDTQCRDCHNAPDKPLSVGRVEIDHAKFIASQLSCEQLCHNKQMDPNTHVSDVRCLDCHDFRNQGQYVAEDLHIRHNGKDKVECLACHEMVNHSANPIEKHHTSLKCDWCHQVPFEGARLAAIEFIKLPSDCSLCHNDPHSGQFQEMCLQCHSEHGWTGRWVADTHGPDADFPLVGKHRSVECSRCHIGAELARARFTGLPQTCEQCHPDLHDGQFTKGCPTCHSEQGWKNLLTDPHGAGSSHPLRGKHASLECVTCHTPPEPGSVLAEARFVRVAQEGCVSCHKDPHGGQMRSACDTCHSEQGWTGQHLLFVHDRDSEFKMDRIHSDLSCSSCHKDDGKRLYRPLPKTCELCHADIVKQQLAKDGRVINPHAGRVSCVQCHSPQLKHQAPAVYANACRACHNTHYEGLFYDWMKSFNSRRNHAEDMLELVRNKDPLKAQVLEQKIDQAESTGFHNLGFALRLWDEIEGGD
jgi:nitrate/TMAO reductase-like tetraheme cytochrome c subunit